MSSYGQIRAGSLLLYDQTIEATDVDLGDLQFTNLSISGTARLRTATTPTCIMSYHHAYSKEDLLTTESVGANATSVLSTSDAHVALNVTGANGRAVRQTLAYMPHAVGGGTIAYLGAVLSTASPSQPSNIRSRVGLFDDVLDTGTTGNGFFFELFGGVLSVVHRRSTAGSSQTDTTVARASFSDDKLDGTGPQAFTFVPTVFNVFVVDMTFAGSGVVRMGVMSKNIIVYAHTFSFANSSTPFVRYPTLPVRFEIQNTAASSQTDTMRISSAAVWSEGTPIAPRTASANTGSTPILVSTTTRRPLLSIRLRTSTIRATLFLRTIEALVDRECLIEVLHGGTLTGSSFSQAGTCSEIDTSATAITGGRLIKASFAERRTTIDIDKQLENAITATTIAGSDSFILTIAVSKIDANALAAIAATWEELL